jgi:filamentous hemagglutinin family protein
MQHYLLTLLTTGLLCLTLTARAQISLDGTLGKSGALSGPNYQIGADLGQQHGGNLFHSFRDFNLQSHESATFSGPNNVQNIISRVTGGNPSSIDGTLRSTIPNADMYFLNPYGIMFGKNAKLDVQGGFHASTADYLRLQDGGRFEARVPSNSLLTVAPVAAFGFLTEVPGEIRLQDSKLSVSEGKTLSLIGGTIFMEGEPLVHSEDGRMTTVNNVVSANSGRINLASATADNEIMLTESGLNFDTETRKGQITVRNSAILSYSGNIFIHGDLLELVSSGIINEPQGSKNSGVIDIRANNFKLTNSYISATTAGEEMGGTIVIKVKDTLIASGRFNTGWAEGGIFSNSYGTGEAGNVQIEARQITLRDRALIGTNAHSAGSAGRLEIRANQISITNGAQIGSNTFENGNGGPIIIVADTLVISGWPSDEKRGDSGVYTNSISTGKNAGNGGHIEVKAAQITLADGGKIASTTEGPGKGGSITILTNLLTASGNNKEGTGSGVLANSVSPEDNGGKAGSINIEAHQITLIDGAQISNSSFGGGEGGSIDTKVGDTLTASGESKAGYPSGVLSNSESTKEHAGNAGQIRIDARQITLKDGATIASQTNGSGTGGSITIKVGNSLTALGNYSRGTGSGVNTSSISPENYGGSAGKLTIEASQVILKDGAQISSSSFGGGEAGAITVKVTDTLTVSGESKAGFSSGIFGNSQSEESYAGDASDVSVQAGTIQLTDGSQVVTDALNASGGNISIITSNLLYLRKGAIFTSVVGGKGNGGNINIASPVFLVLDKAAILAQADEGKGGNITITANHRVSSKPESNNVIDATSRKNISGKVVIKAQEEEVGGTLTILPATLKNYNIIKKRCTTEKIADRKKRSKFVITGRGGVSDAPTQLRAGSVMDVTKEQLW